VFKGTVLREVRLFPVRLSASLGIAAVLAVTTGTCLAQSEGVPVVACDQQPYSILVTVKNIKDTKGTITIDLHDDNPEKFLKSGGKLARLRFPSEKGEMKICVPVEKGGVYALALYQDRDSNQKLDKTWIGLPAEPYGISNDAPMRLGPPKHKDAKFEVTGKLTPVTVTLHN
jgi:uncharacterized protein (DUF2141 family)